MEKRPFGKTGLMTSILGFGGFHLCEIPYKEAELLLNQYLDKGGNYIETAPSYGNGESEIKIGRAVAHRRSEYILVTKAHDRTYEGCMESIRKSLINLNTDFIDVLLLHAVDTSETLDTILGEQGALKACEEAKSLGLIKHIGLSMHGQPDVLIEALNRYDFEAVMTTINYFDHCNFPTILNELVPLARSKECAIILMKALGDGYLYKNVDQAFKFALSQPVSVLVAGINTVKMLEKDIQLFEEAATMTEEEMAQWMVEAPELGNYVCRQCGKCVQCPEGIDIPNLFLLEGLFDRQMGDGNVEDAGMFALKERLKHWFGTAERARQAYSKLEINGKNCTKCGQCMSACPYHIDIMSKIANIDYKIDKQDGKIFE